MNAMVARLWLTVEVHTSHTLFTNLLSHLLVVVERWWNWFGQGLNRIMPNIVLWMVLPTARMIWNCANQLPQKIYSLTDVHFLFPQRRNMHTIDFPICKPRLKKKILGCKESAKKPLPSCILIFWNLRTGMNANVFTTQVSFDQRSGNTLFSWC